MILKKRETNLSDIDSQQQFNIGWTSQTLTTGIPLLETSWIAYSFLLLRSGPGTQLLSFTAAYNLLSPISTTDPLITTSLPHRATHGTVGISISLTFPWLFFFDRAKEILNWMEALLSFNYWEDNSLLETEIAVYMLCILSKYLHKCSWVHHRFQSKCTLAWQKSEGWVKWIIFATLQISAICAYSLFSSEIKVLLEIQKVNCWDQTSLFIF